MKYANVFKKCLKKCMLIRICLNPFFSLHFIDTVGEHIKFVIPLAKRRVNIGTLVCIYVCLTVM